VGITQRTSFKLLSRQGTSEIYGWTSVTANSPKNIEIHGVNNWKKNSCLDMLFIERVLPADSITFTFINHADSCAHEPERCRNKGWRQIISLTMIIRDAAALAKQLNKWIKK